MPVKPALLLAALLAACAPDPEAPQPEAAPAAAVAPVAAPAAAPDPWDPPDVADMAPWPVMGRDLQADELFTAATLVTADEAMAGTFQPRAERAPHAFGLPVDWSADPHGDANWRFHLAALRLIDPLIVGWARTGEGRYLDRAAAVALDWVEAHPSAEAKRKAGTWKDMTAGLRALRLAWLHDRVEAGDVAMSVDDLAKLEASLDQHRIALLNPRYWRQHNHALYAMHGLMAACRARAEAEGCDRERGYAREGVLRVLRGSYAPDGGHKEHSPKYHDFVLKTLGRLVDSGWYDLPGTDAAILSAAEAASGWMSDASGNYPNVGDSERDPNKRAHLAPGPVPGCEAGDVDAAACARLKLFPDTGYAVLKTAANVPEDRRASLFLTCARHGRAHKQLDSLSFEWMDRGRRLLVDGGKLHYNADDARSHLLSRAAHNTASMEGGDAYRAPHTGACLDGAALTDGVMTAGGAAMIGEDALHERTLAYAVGDALSVTDTVTGGAFRLRWNLAPGLAAAPVANGYAVSDADGPVMTAALPQACAWDARTGDADDPAAGAVTSEQYLEVAPITVLEGRCPAGTGPVTSRFALAGSG